MDNIKIIDHITRFMWKSKFEKTTGRSENSLYSIVWSYKGSFGPITIWIISQFQYVLYTTIPNIQEELINEEFNTM